MNNNIQLFPARISDRVVEASEMPKGASASGGYSPTTDTAKIPVADNAYSRTVRLHESGHAIWSRDTKPGDMIEQALEDAKVHQHLETTGSVRRDELSAALTDLRQVKKGGLPDRTRALDGLIMIRAGSILAKSSSSSLGQSSLEALARKYHPQGPELLREILAEVETGNREQARALTSKFFNCSSVPQSENGEGDGDGEGEGKESNGKPGKAKPQSSQAIDARMKVNPVKSEAEDGESEAEPGKEESDSNDESETGEQPSPYTDAKPKPEIEEEPLKDEIQGGKLDDYVPALIKKGERICALEAERRDSEDGIIESLSGDDGTFIGSMSRGKKIHVPYPILYVHTLSPNATRRVRGKGRNQYKSASQGMKIRVNRLALNAANPCGGGRLFETKHLGGTVLLDASGSMRLKDASLYEIAEKFPAGKVAYYSGKQDGWWLDENPDAETLEKCWSGDLVVYAQNGRIRKDHGERLPKRYGANLVDYAAICWLLKQPAPRYLMTDQAFTGTDRLAQKAKQFLADAVAQKKITVYPSMTQLMNAIKKIH